MKERDIISREGNKFGSSNRDPFRERDRRGTSHEEGRIEKGS